MEELYETNEDFKRYVNAHSHMYKMSIEESLKQALVKEYADYIKSQHEQPL